MPTEEFLFGFVAGMNCPKNFLFCVWIFKYNWKRCTLSTLSFSSFNWAKYVHASKDVNWYLSLNDVISWFFNNTIARVSTCRERNRKKRKKNAAEMFHLVVIWHRSWNGKFWTSFGQGQPWQVINKYERGMYTHFSYIIIKLTALGKGTVWAWLLLLLFYQEKN